MTEKRLVERILGSIGDTPMLSPSTSRLLALSTDIHHGLCEVVKIIQNDALLTARILKIVNSPSFSHSVVITDIERAVSLLGEDLVVGLALREAASVVFDKPLRGYEAGEIEFWHHDLKTAIAAKKLSRYARQPQSAELAFTCGLLHDLGKSVLAGWLANSADRKTIIEKIDKGQFSDFLEAEEEILGVTHAEAGFALAMHWQLPPPLPGVIRCHHTPSHAPEYDKSLAFLVHLGDALAMMGGSGTGKDSLRYKMDQNFPRFLTLGAEDLAALFLEVEEEFRITIATQNC